jgi:hypothetical protein
MGRGRAKAKQVKVARQLKYSGGGMDLDQLRAEFGVGTEQQDAEDHAAYADFANRYSVDEDEDDEDEDAVDDEDDDYGIGEDLDDLDEDDLGEDDLGEDDLGEDDLDEDFGDEDDLDEDLDAEDNSAQGAPRVGR